MPFQPGRKESHRRNVRRIREASASPVVGQQSQTRPRFGDEHTVPSVPTARNEKRNSRSHQLQCIRYGIEFLHMHLQHASVRLHNTRRGGFGGPSIRASRASSRASVQVGCQRGGNLPQERGVCRLASLLTGDDGFTPVDGDGKFCPFSFYFSSRCNWSNHK